MFNKILIANRGEIAIRIARAIADVGTRSAAVYSSDDARSLHVRKADEAVQLDGHGVGAYLDIDALIMAARQAECDAVHPGYGFLSENAEFARRCADEGLCFIGPSAETLELFGDKLKTRAFAQRCGVPVANGSPVGSGVVGALELLESLGSGGAIVIKAVGGGGGRGMRIVDNPAMLEEAFARCSSEAKAAFGNGAVYVEQLVRNARHIEVQVVGDGCQVSHVWERECSIQRRHQKLIEVAPSPSLSPSLRTAVIDAAMHLAKTARYNSLGTFEFLVDVDQQDEPSADGFVFMEVNPRLQVEHTVTEMVTGIDLVASQINIAAGATLEDVGLTQPEIPEPHGYAVQLRINMETIQPDGDALPTGGTISVFEPPSGPGIRVDALGYSGYRTSPSFDSLLAKLVVYSPGDSYAAAIRRTSRALNEFRIEGIDTNIDFLSSLLARPEVRDNHIHTRFLEENVASLVCATAEQAEPAFFSAGPADQDRELPVLDQGGTVLRSGTVPVVTPMLGTIVSIDVRHGDPVLPGQPVAVVEAMKMEHVVTSPVGGIVAAIIGAAGMTIEKDSPILLLEPRDGVDFEVINDTKDLDLSTVRADLAKLRARTLKTLDEGRPEAVAKRHGIGQRTARENIADLVDPDSFIEYGALVIAAQRARRSHADLVDNTPADGLIAGLASVNGDRFDEARSRVSVISYDWTVFAGTQGVLGHKKKDRVLKVAHELRLPLVLFSEGGGGRPGDTEFVGPAGLDIMTFWHLARLSGLAPIVGITSRYCFAGNAALLAMCDVIIATEDSNIGMGGPAMIEGGGLGRVAAEEIGPTDTQTRNGVIDILVEDEAAAVAAAKLYLSYFQGPVNEWDCADQRLLRHLIPENRLRSYEIREVIDALADAESVLELRRDFGVGMVTALIRIEGRPIGLIANNSKHLGGAVDSAAADKGARFMQLCDAFDLPILLLCDTPGFMVGPEAEKDAQVRHFGRLFVTGANLQVPLFSIVLRKGYGLGAQGSSGGGFHAPAFIVSWPTGEFGGMGLEGHVQLAFAKELAAIDDLGERQAEYERLVAGMYEKGSAISMAEDFEIDSVIDPAESRRWIMRGLKSLPSRGPRDGKRRPNIDTW